MLCGLNVICYFICLFLALQAFFISYLLSFIYFVLIFLDVANNSIPIINPIISITFHHLNKEILFNSKNNTAVTENKIPCLKDFVILENNAKFFIKIHLKAIIKRVIIPQSVKNRLK